MDWRDHIARYGRATLPGRRWMRLSPTRADAFLARLQEIQEEFEAPQPDESEATFYEFLIGMYPTEPPDGSSEL